MMKADTLVVGGGVSGMAAAIEAARAGDRPVIMEALNQPGKKLLATGNGRCNLVNRGSFRYYGDAEFAGAVLGESALAELTAFWNGLGIMLRFDAEGRGYPCTFSSATVLEALKAELRRYGIPIHTDHAVLNLERVNGRFTASFPKGESWDADRVIISTGGAAQPSLGGNQSAWKWLEETGHRMVPAEPALTPLVTDALSVSGLDGLRVRCRLTILTGGAPVHSEQGELLFTKHGVSGICVMQCSRFVSEGRSEASLDLFPDLFPEEDGLAAELGKRRGAWAGDPPETMLRGLCAPRMAYAVCKQAGIPLRGERAGDLSEAQIGRIAHTMKDYRVRILRKEGFDRAQVMAGGVDCGDVDPETLESRRCPGLHMTGELLNVDGDCGGFNLMFAAMSGIKAGRNGRKSIR